MSSSMNLSNCVKTALSHLPAEARARFSREPKAALSEELGLVVTPVEHLTEQRNDGGACDGMSFLEDGVVLYAPTPNSRRENFTLAHELGHWLVDQASECYDWLADLDDPGRMLETVCDHIAQELLLTDDVVRQVVGDGPPVAQNLLDLYTATHASRPVCAIALARHLPGLGAVTIINRKDRTVAHASVKPDPEKGWPQVFPWRGQQVPAGHSLLALPTGQRMTRRLSWRTPWDAQADYFVDAVAEVNWIHVLFSGSDLWNIESFQVPIERDFDTRPKLWGYCCGRKFETRGYPCPNCRKPYCPSCKNCPCDRASAAAVVCTNCFIERQAHLVTDGVCLDCRS